MQKTSTSPCRSRVTYASAPNVPVKTTPAEFLAAKRACKKPEDIFESSHFTKATQD